jgi:hypothetical protein
MLMKNQSQVNDSFRPPGWRVAAPRRGRWARRRGGMGGANSNNPSQINNPSLINNPSSPPINPHRSSPTQCSSITLRSADSIIKQRSTPPHRSSPTRCRVRISEQFSGLVVAELGWFGGGNHRNIGLAPTEITEE